MPNDINNYKNIFNKILKLKKIQQQLNKNEEQFRKTQTKIDFTMNKLRKRQLSLRKQIEEKKNAIKEENLKRTASLKAINKKISSTEKRMSQLKKITIDCSKRINVLSNNINKDIQNAYQTLNEERNKQTEKYNNVLMKRNRSYDDASMRAFTNKFTKSYKGIDSMLDAIKATKAYKKKSQEQKQLEIEQQIIHNHMPSYAKMLVNNEIGY